MRHSFSKHWSLRERRLLCQQAGPEGPPPAEIPADRRWYLQWNAVQRLEEQVRGRVNQAEQNYDKVWQDVLSAEMNQMAQGITRITQNPNTLPQQYQGRPGAYINDWVIHSNDVLRALLPRNSINYRVILQGGNLCLYRDATQVQSLPVALPPGMTPVSTEVQAKQKQETEKKQEEMKKKEETVKKESDMKEKIANQELAKSIEQFNAGSNIQMTNWSQEVTGRVTITIPNLLSWHMPVEAMLQAIAPGDFESPNLSTFNVRNVTREQLQQLLQLLRTLRRAVHIQESPDLSQEAREKLREEYLELLGRIDRQFLVGGLPYEINSLYGETATGLIHIDMTTPAGDGPRMKILQNAIAPLLAPGTTLAIDTPFAASDMLVHFRISRASLEAFQKRMTQLAATGS